MQATKGLSIAIQENENEREVTLPKTLPKLRDIRKSLTQADFKRHQEDKVRKREFEAKDPVGYLLAQKEYYQKELKSDNHYRRGKARVILDELEISLESARKIAEEKAEMAADARYQAEETLNDLTKAALEKGPLWSQKVGWKTKDFFSKLKPVLTFVPDKLKSLWHWYEECCQWVSLWVWILALITNLIFSIYYSLGINGFWVTFILLILGFISFLYDINLRDSNSGKPFYSLFFILTLLLGQTAMIGWRCFTLSDGYAAITKKSNEIIDVVNTGEHLFMRSPHFWLGERLEILPLYNKKIIDAFEVSVSSHLKLFGEEWHVEVGRFGNKPVFVNVKAEKFVNTDNLKKVISGGQAPTVYRDDIRRQVEQLIARFSQYKNPATAQLELERDIEKIKNDLFYLKNIDVSLKF